MPDKPGKFICDGCGKPFKHVAPQLEMKQVVINGETTSSTWHNMRFCRVGCAVDCFETMVREKTEPE